MKNEALICLSWINATDFFFTIRKWPLVLWRLEMMVEFSSTKSTLRGFLKALPIAFSNFNSLHCSLWLITVLLLDFEFLNFQNAFEYWIWIFLELSLLGNQVWNILFAYISLQAKNGLHLSFAQTVTQTLNDKQILKELSRLGCPPAVKLTLELSNDVFAEHFDNFRNFNKKFYCWIKMLVNVHFLSNIMLKQNRFFI